MNEESLRKGREVMGKLGIANPESRVNREDAERTTANLFGEVWADERHLALAERSLVTLVCLVTQGGVEEPLRIHLRGARRLGISREKIEAVLTHLSFYAGYPKSSTARQIARSVFAEEDKAGGPDAAR